MSVTKEFQLTELGKSEVSRHAELAAKIGRGFARRFKLDEDDAVSEAGEILVGCIATYNPNRSTIESYIKNKLWFQLLDWRRKPARAARHGMPVPLESNPDDGGAASHESFCRMLATRYLGMTGPKDRELLTAHFVEGKTTAEIAREMGYHPTWVKTKIRRGLESIRKHPDFITSEGD